MDYLGKYIGVVSQLVELHNLVCNASPGEIDEDRMDMMDRVASDFNAACGKLEMKRNGGKRYGIFDRR